MKETSLRPTGCVPSHLGKHGRASGGSHARLPPCSAPADQAPLAKPLLSQGPGAGPAYCWKQVSVLCQPRRYSGKPTPSSSGNWGSPHPLVTTEPATHSRCLFTLFLGVALAWPCLWRPPPLGSECLGLTTKLCPVL